jgi:hypothetical protein
LLPALGSPILPTTLATPASAPSPTIVPPSLNDFSLPPELVASQPVPSQPVPAEPLQPLPSQPLPSSPLVSKPLRPQLAAEGAPSWLSGVDQQTIAWGAALLMVLGLFVGASGLLLVILLL